jgi:hypothetical protein
MHRRHGEIEEYANSMFRFESLPEDWIDKCASYINYIFGNRIYNKVVIDYAFGRGNWSLAFLKAGAAKVIAIDASISNVIRFKEFCKRNKINNIEIISGNILLEDINVKGDILWLYGILPMIHELDNFLKKIKKIALSKDALLYVYYYNAGCLREFTVECCRRILRYSTEEDFLQDSVLFLRPAYIRARDDLTTPHIAWKSAGEIQSLLKKHGIYINHYDNDFNEFIYGKASEEFYAHQFLCSFYKENEIEINDRKMPYQKEITILKEFAGLVFSEITLIDKKKIAIGLFNTHFAYLKQDGDAKEAIIEIFIFMANILLMEKALRNRKYSLGIETYLALKIDSAAGLPREHYKAIIGDNYFTDYLCQNRIRN